MVLDHLLTGGTGIGLGGLADAALQVSDLSDLAVPLWLVALGVVALWLLMLAGLEAGPKILAATRARALGADTPWQA